MNVGANEDAEEIKRAGDIGLEYSDTELLEGAGGGGDGGGGVKKRKSEVEEDACVSTKSYKCPVEHAGTAGGAGTVGGAGGSEGEAAGDVRAPAERSHVDAHGTPDVADMPPPTSTSEFDITKLWNLGAAPSPATAPPVSTHLGLLSFSIFLLPLLPICSGFWGIHLALI